MNKALILLGVMLFGVTTALAEPEAGKARYLVATRRPARQLSIRFDRDVDIRRFESVNGFAAELTEAEVAELRKSGEVLWVGPDELRYAVGTVPSSESFRPVIEGAAVAPAATSTQQTPYGITMVGAPRVWNLGRGRTIKVAVIDSGIEKAHPDIADDYKGGYDFVNNDEDPEDENGHGTHVAGTIGALDNLFGVVGVAPDVEIYSLRVLGPTGSGSVSSEIRAIDWAIENHMNIINLSLGSNRAETLEEQALGRARDAGIIVVAASGNSYSGVDGLIYPAGYSSVLSVGAINEQQNIASFSQRGSTLKLVAPGVSVLSLNTYAVDVSSGDNIYDADLLEGSPRGTISGEFVFCGLGAQGDFPPSVQGKIALIERGSITFREKTQNAVNAGAVAVAIFNNDNPYGGWTLIRDGDGNIIPDAASFPWPVTVGMTKESGTALRQLPPGSQMSINTRSGGYRLSSGTSMSAPHVAGVAALVWSLAPQASAEQVRQALLDSAVDLGTPGFDTTFGFGGVDAFAAAKRIAPEKFGANPRRRGVRH